jgi:hypothetical protein
MIPLLLIGGAVAAYFATRKKSDSENGDSEQEVKQNRIAALSSPIFATTKSAVPRPQTTSPAYTTPQIIRTPQTRRSSNRRVR